MSRFRAILWDIDGTLLNFDESERYGIRKIFDIFKLGECTDEMLADYSAINLRYWEALERGEITKKQVMDGRFKEFLGKYNLHVDSNEELNREYQIALGEKVFPQPYGLEIVRELKGAIPQFIVTNGNRTTQDRKLELSGLGELCDGVFISEDMGAEKPSEIYFDRAFELMGEIFPELRDLVEKSEVGSEARRDVIIIGDSLTSDMRGGNNAGLTTCWYNPSGKINDKGVILDYEIESLQELWELL